jgi:hypothetical protein
METDRRLYIWPECFLEEENSGKLGDGQFAQSQQRSKTSTE